MIRRCAFFGGLRLPFEEAEEFLVGFGGPDAVDHGLGGVLDFLAGKGTTQKLRGFEAFPGKEEFFAAGGAAIAISPARNMVGTIDKFSTILKLATRLLHLYSKLGIPTCTVTGTWYRYLGTV